MSYFKNRENSLEDTIRKGLPEDGYQDKFKKELEKAGKGVGSMTPKEKSAFFNKVDDIKKTDKEKKEVKEEVSINERGGANTSTKQGSFAKSRKPKYRFGYRVAEKDPSKEMEKVGKSKVESVINSISSMWGEAAQDTEDRGDSKLLPTKNKVETKKESNIPAIKKDNKPGVKIAKIRAIRDKDDGSDVGEKEKDPAAMEKQILTLQGQVNQLKVKLENEKNKAVKPEPNKETGEVPLTVGIAHKILRDKAEKKEEDEKNGIKKEAKEAPGFKDYVMNFLKQEKDKVLDKGEKGKGKTMTGEPATKVDTKPEIKYNH
tara:strand:- start:3188 stop:4138 length:951 start_codon:yes stop_codon:yes gene_type:complete